MASSIGPWSFGFEVDSFMLHLPFGPFLGSIGGARWHREVAEAFPFIGILGEVYLEELNTLGLFF